jgi:hypothetical protein
MMTGQQYTSSGVGNPDRDPGVGLQGGEAGRKNEAKPRMTPADFFYRIATLTTIAFLLATLL